MVYSLVLCIYLSVASGKRQRLSYFALGKLATRYYGLLDWLRRPSHLVGRQACWTKSLGNSAQIVEFTGGYRIRFAPKEFLDHRILITPAHEVISVFYWRARSHHYSPDLGRGIVATDRRYISGDRREITRDVRLAIFCAENRSCGWRNHLH